MKYRVTHTTAYEYDKPVSASYSQAHLVPRRLAHQACLSSELSIDPVPLDYREHYDFFDNRTSVFSIHDPHTSLRVTAVSVVDVSARGGQLALGAGDAWDTVVARIRTDTSTTLTAVTRNEVWGSWIENTLVRLSKKS